MKGASIAGGIVAGLILALVGFLFVGPGGSNSYVAPAQIGGISIVGFPVGYLFLTGKTLTRRAVGVIAMLGMATALYVVWTPLLTEEWMLETHGAMLGLWTLLWLTAAAPFFLAVVRR